MSADPGHELLRHPQGFSTLLTGLRPVTWPPDEADVLDLARACAGLIECVDAWESATGGQNVRDAVRGEITTADVRRLLAQEVALSQEGDVAVLLVPPGEQRVRVEIRAEVDQWQGLLRRPEMVLDWEDDEGHTHSHYVSLRPKGPQWYMLSQLRDDVKEGRFVVPMA